MLFAGETNLGSTFLIYGLMIAALIAIFWFSSRSRKKEQQAVNEMLNALQIGDEVTTIGDIIGQIVSMKEETVTIETSKDRTKIRFLKTAIRNVDVKADEKGGEN